ncbi:MAG: hypothetical protein IJ609_00690, partial [Paludibacteraceae bacterium]|nr:hypothetical protein [Paludibacteraceae bacterium]
EDDTVPPCLDGPYSVLVNGKDTVKAVALTGEQEYDGEGRKQYVAYLSLTKKDSIQILNESCGALFVPTVEEFGAHAHFAKGLNALTIDSTGCFDLYLKLQNENDRLYIGYGICEDDTVPVVTGAYYMKNNWNGATDWTWKAMTADGETFKLENVVYGGSGVNYNTAESDENSSWVAQDAFLGDAIHALDTVTLVLNPETGKVTVEVTGAYVVPADAVYYMKNNWNAGEWAWKLMTKDGADYKLENVVYGGTGVNYNTVASDGGSNWVAEEAFLGDQVKAKDTVNIVLNPTAGTITVTVIGAYAAPVVPAKNYYLVGEFNEWDVENAVPFVLNEGVYTITIDSLFGGFKVLDAQDWQHGDYGRWPDEYAIPVDGEYNLLRKEGETVNYDLTLDGTYENAVLTLTEADDVLTLHFVSGTLVEDTPEPQSQYGLMLDDVTFVAAAVNPANTAEYMVLGLALAADQTVQLYDQTYSAGWVITNYNEGSATFTVEDDHYVISAAEAGVYDFYFTLGPDAIYISKQSVPTALDRLTDSAEPVKALRNGQVIIIRGEHIYNTVGRKLQ